MEDGEEGFGLNEALYYLRARWMDPSLGRFLSVDPFAGISRNPITRHRYIYANNDPIAMVDPSGQFSRPALIAVAAVMTIALAGFVATDLLRRGNIRARNTIRMTLTPVVVNQTWDNTEAQVHLLQARTVFRRFGIALNWEPISTAAPHNGARNSASHRRSARRDKRGTKLQAWKLDIVLSDRNQIERPAARRAS